MAQSVFTENAPKAIGPYSQAIIYQGVVYCSGQTPTSPITQNVIDGGIEEQTRQSLENLKAVIEAAGSKMENALKVTVYLSDMNNFAKMNEIYAQYFTGKPARSTIQAARLPKDVLVEIDCIAFI